MLLLREGGGVTVFVGREEYRGKALLLLLFKLGFGTGNLK